MFSFSSFHTSHTPSFPISIALKNAMCRLSKPDSSMSFIRFLESLSISQIAWLLGYQEVSAFTHAFKRWTGRTPREARTAS